jgi:hypothetical protein
MKAVEPIRATEDEVNIVGDDVLDVYSFDTTLFRIPLCSERTAHDDALFIFSEDDKYLCHRGLTATDKCDDIRKSWYAWYIIY